MSRIPLAVPLLVSLAPLAAQADWRTDLYTPKPRAVHAAAYDQARNEVVLFGGNANSGALGDTWLWSVQGGWRQANPATAPEARLEHGMAYDATRREVVLFGGRNRSGALLDDTWVWDGTNWIQRTPATRPSPRTAELAWDPSGSAVLLFGGDAGSGTRLNDTWTWNGTGWTRLTPGTNPAARGDHALATDWGRGEVVMFGGWDNGFLADTWTFNGGNWSQHLVAGPSARSEHRMAYYGLGVALFSGDTGAGRPQDTWHWSGTAWAQLTLGPMPAGREEHEMIWVPGLPGALLFGGWAPGIGHLADPWTLQISGRWTRHGADGPPGTGTHGMAFDPDTGRTLMFGGYQDTQINSATWSLQNGTWTVLTPATSPPRRAETALAYDEARKEFVLFGGVDGNNHYNDTWVFRAGNWVLRPQGNPPPPRWGHAMAYDPGRRTVVLFSGRAGGTGNNLADTWEWNGTSWNQLAIAGPAGREDTGMAYDRQRGEMVLFGGWVMGRGFVGDLWVFKGGSWQQQNPGNPPTPRSEHVMAYDSWRGRLVVFGGQDGSGRVNDTWEWTGTQWIQRTPTRAPHPREEAAMVFDPVNGECVLFAGWDVGHFHDTWTYGSRPGGTLEYYGTGCRGSAAGEPTLELDRLWLGDRVTYTVTAPGPTTTAFLFVGLSQAIIPLDPIGMPGCTHWLTPLLEFRLAATGNTATLSASVPNQPALIGAKLVNQAAVTQPGANPLGVLATAGLQATVGMR